MAVTPIKSLTTGFGTVTYNGLTFGALRDVSVESTMIYDANDITAKAVRYKLKVHAWIWGATLNDQQDNMTALQNKLQVPGKQLIIENIGLFTKLDTKSTGTYPDIAGGPHPRLLSMSPAGGDLAWEVTWVVEFTISACKGNSFSSTAFLSLAFDVTYSVDDRGFVTRRISGTAEIPKQRNGDYYITNASSAFDRLTFFLPHRMKRLNSTRMLSRDRSKIEFSIIDEELRTYPFPDGIIDADVDYTFENRPPGFTEWTASLSGTYETAHGYPPSLAAEKFFILLFDKAAKLQQVAASIGGVAIPERIRVSTKQFGRVSSFSVQIRFSGCLSEILQNSGMWRQMPNASYESWATSLASKGVNSVIGVRGLRPTGSEDYVVDLCSSSASKNFKIGDDSYSYSDPYESTQGILSCSGVTEGNSWLQYKNRLRVVVAQRGTVHRAAQFFSGVALGALPTSAAGLLLPVGKPAVESAVDSVFQYEGEADNLVIMQGKAARLKFSPDIPKLVSVGGVAVEEITRVVEVEPIAGVFGCPLYTARWAILYRVKGQVEVMSAPKNKQFCTDEGEVEGGRG